MTLTLRPPGRGNWSPVIMRVQGRRASPLFIRPGSLITLGGMTFRVAKVML